MVDEEVDDQLSQRFQDNRSEDSNANESTPVDAQADTESDTSQASSGPRTSGSSQTSSTSQKSQTSGCAQNIKKEWSVRSIYLPDNLDNELGTTFKRLDLELEEAGVGIDLQKTRHFYPLLIRLGLEQVDKMEPEDVADHLS